VPVVVTLATFAFVWCLAGGGAPSPLARLQPQRGRAAARGSAGPGPVPPARGPRSTVEDPRRRLALCVTASAAAGWLLAGSAGAVIGAPVGIALSWWTSRLESPTHARERERISRDLPLAAELLAACAFAGRPFDDGLRLVSRAVGGPLGDRLDAVTARLDLGSDPLTEWRRAAEDPQLAMLARTMVRAIESGAPIGDGLMRLAEDRRRERRTQTSLRARNVGVKAAGPLAACFLPAFMLIGIVPTIAGAFTRLVL
jgi:Flp pilus assembly protein TadB